MNESRLDSAPAQVSPGARLRLARESEGLSEREVADRLHWLPTYVSIIERDKFDALRRPSLARGYLRAYARMLGVSEVEVIAAYDSLPQPVDLTEHAPIPVSRNRWPRDNAVGVMLGLGALSLLILLLWWGADSPPAALPQATLEPTGVEGSAPLEPGIGVPESTSSSSVGE